MESSAAQLRKSAALRVLVSVLVAAGLTTLAIVATWGPLDLKTDVIGNPTFHNFNVENYFTAYYFVMGFFPLAALFLFLGLTRLAPRIGLAVPPPRGSLRPASLPADQRPRLAPEQPLADAPAIRRRAVCAGRIGFVGVIVGLETGIAIDSIEPGLTLGIGGYAAATLLTARLLGRWRRDWPFEARLAAANSFGAAVSFAGLIAVSMSTQVLIASDGSVDHHPWLPAWVGLPVAAALSAAVGLAMRRATSAARALEIERRALLLIAAPVFLLLSLQMLPGESGELDYFHGGEQVVGARLVENGFFPWRDLVLTHGIFQDVVYDFARGIFGYGVWGHAAGIGMIMKPLYLISVFLLLVYLVGRNWLFLLFSALLLIGPTVAPEQFRLILWPLILLLLATDLNRPTAWKSIGLAFLLVAQTMLTPEAAPAIPAVALALVAYECYWRRPGEPIASSFSRTLWVGGAGLAFAALTAGYLAAHGALDDFVYVSRNLVHGHTLSGGQPPAPNPDSVSDAAFHAFALIPPAALLISFAYAVARLRLRRPLYTEDWVMAAAAIFLLLYYTKFLARMDTGHVYQPFVAGLPLFLYIVYRVVTWVEGAIRDHRARNPLLRVTSHPVSLALVALVAVLSWGTYRDRIEKAPSFYRPAVSEPVKFDQVGYTQAFPGTAYRDLKRVIDAYLGPDDRLFDFSNTPLLFFSVIDRLPSTRYFHVSLTYSAELQADLIKRLSKARPKLIVFDNDSSPFFGLSSWDGIPNMVRSYEVGRWILDRYRPLLWTHGFTIYARRDQPPASKVALDLAGEPVIRGIPFTVQPCAWGTAPNFLSDPAMPGPAARAVGTRARSEPDQVTVVGWAGDPKAELPAREVIATVDGRIVGRTKPNIARPDLTAYGLPQGFEPSGFQLQVKVQSRGPFRVFGVSRDGRLSQLVAQGAKPEKGTTTIDGHRVRLDPKTVYGQLNSTTRERALQFSLPPGSSWGDYRWLEVDAGKSGFKPGTMTVYDRPTRRSADREIAFETLDDSPRRYVVPVGSCAQWHGYRGSRLFLNFDTPQDISAVRLIR